MLCNCIYHVNLCVQCVVHCVFHHCVCECVCVCMWITDCIDMSMNKWINEHVVMQIMKDHFFCHTSWKKTSWGNKKRLLASQHLAKKILANVPECTQQKNGCSSHWSSAFSASATAAAHSLIWQHRTLGMNTDYWHLEWTPTLINTQLKVPLYAHPWASLWPSQLSKDLQLQTTYQQHAPTTTPSITTKSMLRERLPSGIFLVWYMS